MPPFLQFVIRRFLVIPVSLAIITLVLDAGVMLTPPEARATLYMPENMPPRLTDEQFEKIQENIIRRYHLRDPFPIQCLLWVRSLFDGTGRYSPALNEVERRVVWKHVFRNTLTPSLTSMTLPATSIVTGVFVSEIIYDINGVSGVIVAAMAGVAGWSKTIRMLRRPGRRWETRPRRRDTRSTQINLTGRLAS